VTFSDGNSSIFGAVTNNSGGTLSTYGTSAAGTIISFYSPVTNSAGGLIQINSSTVRFLGGFTGNAPIIVDPADVYFTGLTMGATGVLQGGVGDSFFVTAPFTNAGQINLGGNSQMVVENGGTLTQTSGVLHLGSSATLTAGMVEINGGMLLADGPLATITASLSYASSSISTYQGVLAGARNTLTLDNPAALLVLSGSSNSYTGGTYVEAGTLEITNKSALPNSTSLTIGAGGTFIFDPPLAVAPAMASDISPVPELGTLVLLTVAGLGAAVCQSVRSRRQRF
jgi:autotransporter-associated beta strand protein